MNPKKHSLLIALLIAGLVAGCSTTGEKKNELSSDAVTAKAEFLKSDESLKTVLDGASGYVIFPSVAKGALGVGAATGTGQLFEQVMLSRWVRLR